MTHDLERAGASHCAVIAILLLAFILFVPLFATKGIGAIDFWWWMAGTVIVVIATSCFADASLLPRIRQDCTARVGRKIIFGLLSALALYGVFFLGSVASRSLFSFAAENIHSVYQLKEHVSETRIVLLMLLVIGPGEELFWRGFLQDAIARRSTPRKGLIFATLAYTAVHAASMNPMLILAAFVGGSFWGWLYLRYRSLLLNAVSHTVWDLLVFIILPL